MFCRRQSLLLNRVLLGLVGLLVCLSGTLAAQPLMLDDREATWLAEHPVIRLGVDADYGPYSYLDDQGRLQGVVADFLAAIEAQLGIRFEIVSDLKWPQLMAAVRDRRIDAVATVVRLPEREKFLAFTDIYLPTPLVVMTRADAPQLHSVKALEALRIALVKGYSSSRQLLATYPKLNVQFVDRPLDGLLALSSGEVDAYVGVLGVNSFIAARNGIANIKVNAAFDSANGQRFGVRKDWPELAALLDKALDAIPEEEKQAIFQRWMPRYAGEIERLAHPTLLTMLFPWLLAALALAFMAYLVVLLWNRQLKREVALRRADLERAQAVAHLGDWSMKPGSVLIDCSEELLRIAGREAHGCPVDLPMLRSWIHTDDLARYDDYLQRLDRLGPGEDSPSMLIRLCRPDGGFRWLEVSGAADFDGTGRATRFYGSFQDVTERKQAEETIRQLNVALESRVKQRTEELEQANAELKTFTYSVSHDLKAPLRGIDGYSRLLLEEHSQQLDTEGRQLLGNVRKGVRQMNLLIEDLLAYSRMERRRYQCEPVSLVQIVDEVLGEQQQALTTREAAVRVAVADQEVSVDAAGLAMALRNLIGNALKFTPEERKPLIEISSREEDNHIVLSIRDNGVGFDMRFHERIFEIFQRLQRSEEYPGTGIGLAIVHKALQRMGGRVWAESEPGVGSTFHLELPR